MRKLSAKEASSLKGGSGGARGGPVTVLHIDDDINDSELLRAAILKANLSCAFQQVQDGEQAVAYLNGTGGYQDRERYPLPGLVLLDLKMPCLSGFEVLRWIRGHKILNRLPVIMLSGSALQEDIHRAYEAGATSYLVKPLGFQALVKLMKSLKTTMLMPVPGLQKNRISPFPARAV